MITKAGSELADRIMSLVREQAEASVMHAVRYAHSDDASAKAAFVNSNSLEKTLRGLHSVVCQGLHAVEAEMQKIKTGGAA